MSFLLILSVAVSHTLAATEQDLRSVEDRREAQVRALREAEIVQLRATLETRLPENRRADLFLRQAELHLEAYRADFLLEGRVHERALARGQPSRLDRSLSRRHLAPGIQACNEILKLRIPYSSMDRVYYFLGFNSKELGREQDATRYYRELARQYPQSPWTAEANRELGEDEFRAARFRSALGYLEAASRNLESSSLPLVLHKLAWTYYRLRQTDRAVTTLKEAIRLSVANQQKYVSVKDEALRDMAVFMAEQDRVAEAIQYFEMVSGRSDYLPSVLAKLAVEYERNLKFDKAASVLEATIKISPATRAETLLSLLRLDQKRGRVLEGLKRFDAIALEASEYSAIRALIRATGTDQHAIYRKNQSKASLKIAEAYYLRYLRTLGSGPSVGEKAEISMYLAEIKEARGDGAGAIALYREVVSGRDARYLSQAASKWVSLAKGADYVKAADELHAIDPTRTEALEARLRAAQLLAGQRASREAALDRSKELAKEAPGSPQGVVAARLWLQLLGEARPRSSEAIHEAIEWIRSERRLVAEDEKTGRKLLTQMEALAHQVEDDMIVFFERANDFPRAAQAYEQFALRTRDPKAAAHGFEGAISNYLKAEDPDRATTVLKAWIKRREQRDRVKATASALATHLFIEGKFDRAAAFLGQMGAEFQDPSFFETAARMLRAQRQPVDAVQAWSQAAALSSRSSEEQGRAYYHAAQLEEREGRFSEAGKFYRLCQQTRGAARGLCAVSLGNLFGKQKDIAQARAAYRSAADDTDPRISSLARLRLAEILEQEAELPRLALPEKVLSSALSTRLKVLEQLTSAYELASKKNGLWGVTALFRLSRWTDGFAADVEKLEPAPGASKSADFQFRQTIRGVSSPLRKKSKDLKSRAYRLAVDSELFCPDLPEMVDLLAFKDQAPFRAQGARSRYRVAGMPPSGGDQGLDASLAKVRVKLTELYASDKRIADAEAWVNYGNLLWGQEKPDLASIAYDQALRIKPKDPMALTNKAVVLLSGTGQESWLEVLEARELLGAALTADPFFVTAKINLALLYNYYRLFERARPLWDQVLVRSKTADLLDGGAVALFGTGRFAQAEELFAQAGGQGASESRFVRLYHQAARALIDKRGSRAECLALVTRIDRDAIGGFERESVERLAEECRRQEGGPL